MTTSLIFFQAADEETLESLVTTLKTLEDDYKDYLWQELDIDEPLIDALAGDVVDHYINEDFKNRYGGGFILQLLIDSGFWCWFENIYDGEVDLEYNLLCTSNLEFRLSDPSSHQYLYPNKFQHNV